LCFSHTEEIHAKYRDLAAHAITAKHTPIGLKQQSDFKKRRFLESFFINTTGNVMNSKINDLFLSGFKPAFEVKQCCISLNIGLS